MGEVCPETCKRAHPAGSPGDDERTALRSKKKIACRHVEWFLDVSLVLDTQISLIPQRVPRSS